MRRVEDDILRLANAALAQLVSNAVVVAQVGVRALGELLGEVLALRLALDLVLLEVVVGVGDLALMVGLARLVSRLFPQVLLTPNLLVERRGGLVHHPCLVRGAPVLGVSTGVEEALAALFGGEV